MSEPTAPTLQDIREAADRIAHLVHRTPVMRCQSLDAMVGRELFFKCENLQKVGAFKYRGASNVLALMSPEEASRGVVTHSSGNHAQALALAARMRGVPAHIVMPSNAPAVKRRAVEGYGARVIPCEPTLEARESTAAEVIAETGATFVHPYDDPRIISGQGTAGLELLEDVPSLDAIIAPVGGGGLLSGVAIAAHALKPSIPVFGAEPLGADDAARSMAAGRLIPQTAPNTIADGLLTSLGQHTWPIIRDRVKAIITVEEEAIAKAMRDLWERAKLIVEASGAVPLAATLNPLIQSQPELKRIGIVISGGNVDLDRLPWAKTGGA